ncbi:MAG TPA: FAD-binding protein [Saprospiraceae bacterium]|nr:FAD-binding protein [Saprospiraceae bacterium]HPI07214.1 FAD-binding protein [Saprospiraceae bacterium]
MPQIAELVLLPHERDNDAVQLQKAARQTGLRPDQISHIEILKSSLDARSRQAVYRVRVEVYGQSEIFTPEAAILDGFKPVSGHQKVIIVGAGPAGYFAALELIEKGIQPIVLDRGKDAQARRRDLRAIQQFGTVNPHSNYCFGEGGAGTYSDGKLYTRSVKRGNVYKSLKLLVEHGSKSDILTEAHPHIGSNKLPGVVQNMRATIEKYGGAVHFNHFVTDLVLKNGRLIGVVTEDPEKENSTREWLADAVILATGHSARDIYRLLHKHDIRIEAKPFALGVRVEHPQEIIDGIQYKQNQRDEHLPAASYSLVCQVGGRGVFSFCMCPGGLIVPAATAPGEIVVNGMSMSRRDSPYANSGVVTSIEPEDLGPWNHHGVFAAMEFQSEVERRLFQAGDGSQKGPALRLPDFISGKLSAALPGTSYIPGFYPAPLYELLPEFIYKRLRDGLSQFGKQMRGYYSQEATVVATESRTSAPVRIPRDPLTLMHPETERLFPCGEGAGYAGGIISAAMDGQNVARAVAAVLQG